MDVDALQFVQEGLEGVDLPGDIWLATDADGLLIAASPGAGQLLQCTELVLRPLASSRSLPSSGRPLRCGETRGSSVGP